MTLRKILLLLSVACYPAITLAQSDTMLSLTGAVPTLNEEFKHMPAWRPGAVQTDAKPRALTDPSFSWVAGYLWDHPINGMANKWPPATHDFPAWTSNTTADADPNGDMIAKIGSENSPFSWSGTLHFIARVMPADLAKTIDKDDPKGYMGASINSFPYGQRYGVFAITAKIPSGKGLWPAFWLVPLDKKWPPEIDIFEILGADPTKVYETIHMNGPDGHEAKAWHETKTADLSKGFHEYTVDWGPERINWYLDRKLVSSQPTPPDLHKPCYIIANLGVGKADQWGGGPDASTILPATMEVSAIHVWQRPDYK